MGGVCEKPFLFKKRIYLLQGNRIQSKMEIEIQPIIQDNSSSRSKGVRDTLDSFITKAKLKHGDKFKYHLVQYVNSHTKVRIECDNGHIFEQTPSHHINGDKCPICRGRNRSLEDFIELSKKRFPDKKFDYSKVVFTNMRTPIILICPNNHEFVCVPTVHLRKYSEGGCKKCANINVGIANSYTQEEWISLAREKHKNIYSYDKTLYTCSQTPVVITCNIHGDFEQLPVVHLTGCGCPSCGIEKSASSKLLSDQEKIEKIREAEILHEGKYKYSSIYNSEDNKNRLMIDIICEKHGQFTQRLDHHLNGHGCSKCPVQFSKWSLEYFDYRSVRDGFIQHGGNIGEFIPPEMPKCPVDGWRKDQKEITECQGSYHHGDSRVFSHNDIYFGGKQTLGDRYKATCEKTAKLRSFGYTVIEVWEYDWKRGKNAVVSLQRAFRSKHSE
jgi:hypothetical protein